MNRTQHHAEELRYFDIPEADVQALTADAKQHTTNSWLQQQRCLEYELYFNSNVR